jgi:Tfp pilus assembly protein PilO
MDDQMAEGPARIRKVDLDTGDTGDRPRHPWSLTAMSLPLPVVAVLLVQTIGLVFTIGGAFNKLDAVIETNKEIKADMYKQTDASRDLALRDQRLGECERRVGLLEQYIDGRRK